MGGRWNFIDDYLAGIRTNKIKKYIPKNSLLLDIGCYSDFRLLKELSKYVKKGYGVDLEVEEKQHKNLTLFKIDITKEKIPLKDNSVDVVTMLAVIEHLHSATFIISEIHRVLRKGGVLLLTTPTPQSKPILEFGANIGIFDKVGTFDHKCYYNKKKLLGVLEQKFEIVKHKYFEFTLNQFVVCKKC